MLDLPARKAFEVLCEFPDDIQGTSTHAYTEENFCTKDDAGPLPLALTPRGSASSSQVWTLGRDAVGPVVLHLEILPRVTEAKASPLLEHSNERGEMKDADLISFLTHELVHNWLYLGNNPNKYHNMWYIEGMLMARL